MGLGLKALAWRNFGSTRPVDFQTRGAMETFVRYVESAAWSDTVEERAVELAVAGLGNRDLRVLHVARLLVGGLGRRRADEARMLASAEESLLGAETEREIALLDRQARNRASGP